MTAEGTLTWSTKSPLSCYAEMAGFLVSLPDGFTLSPDSDHTRLVVKKNRRGQTRWSVEPETVDLVRACARLMPDKAIAGMLNRTGQRTGRLNGWTQSRVRSFRSTHGIAVYVDGEWAERGEVTLPEVAKLLGLSPMTVLRQIRTGIIPAKQYGKGAPWVIKRRGVVQKRVTAGAELTLPGWVTALWRFQVRCEMDRCAGAAARRRGSNQGNTQNEKSLYHQSSIDFRCYLEMALFEPRPMSYWVVLAPVVAGTAALGEVGAGATVFVRAAVPAGTMLWRRTIRWPL